MSKTTTTKRTRRSGVRIDERAHGMTPEMWTRLRSKTNEEVLAQARRDPDARPVEDRRPGSLGPVGRASPVKRIRWRLGLSQSQFAATFGIPLGTLRDWEQHRQEPDKAARSYLEVIAREPDAVRRALNKVRA
jgi:putative transcriptional regulator